jgi:peptidoglycan hydrolase CwlO-like protein
LTTLARNISSWVIVVLVVATSGTVGTTVAFQDSAQDVQTENEELRAENEELRQQLNETREEKGAAQARAEALDERLETRNEDVDTLVAELEKKDKLLNASRTRLAESQENQAGMSRSEMEKRLDYLCAQRENRDRFGCQQFGPDE